jgi:hypothetical protein
LRTLPPSASEIASGFADRDSAAGVWWGSSTAGAGGWGGCGGFASGVSGGSEAFAEDLEDDLEDSADADEPREDERVFLGWSSALAASSAT